MGYDWRTGRDDEGLNVLTGSSVIVKFLFFGLLFGLSLAFVGPSIKFMEVFTQRQQISNFKELSWLLVLTTGVVSGIVVSLVLIIVILTKI